MHIYPILAAAAAVTLISACSSASSSSSSTGRSGQAQASSGNLKQSVRAAASAQKQAGQQFQDALNYISSMTGLQSGSHVTSLPKFNAKVQEAEASVALARRQMNQVDAAGPGANRAQFAQVSGSLHRTHASMVTMLARFRGEVQFLQRNLNAKAIISMRGRTRTLQQDLQSLRAQIDRSNALADHWA